LVRRGIMTVSENGEEKLKKSRSKKVFPIIIVAVLLAGFLIGNLFGSTVDVAAWFGNGETGEVETNGGNGFEEAKPQLEQQLRQGKEQEVIMQHLDDLRDAANVETNLDVIDQGDGNVVVASINGEEISKEELLEAEEQEKQQLMMMGMDPESEEAAQKIAEARPQILEKLIANVLLSQKIEEEGISASKEKVDEQYQQYVEQSGGEETLEQQLEQAGITKDELMQEIVKQLSIQTYIENYLADNLDEDELDFSEEELKELYEAQQQQMEQQQQQMDVEEEN
jgi:DNA-binding transcriptional ArsR family regulator